MIDLTKEELELIADALDSHAYWQLSESNERNDGTTLSESGEVRRCAALEQKVRDFLQEQKNAAKKTRRKRG